MNAFDGTPRSETSKAFWLLSGRPQQVSAATVSSTQQAAALTASQLQPPAAAILPQGLPVHYGYQPTAETFAEAVQAQPWHAPETFEEFGRAAATLADAQQGRHPPITDQVKLPPKQEVEGRLQQKQQRETPEPFANQRRKQQGPDKAQHAAVADDNHPLPDQAQNEQRTAREAFAKPSTPRSAGAAATAKDGRPSPPASRAQGATGEVAPPPVAQADAPLMPPELISGGSALEVSEAEEPLAVEALVAAAIDADEVCNTMRRSLAIYSNISSTIFEEKSV